MTEENGKTSETGETKPPESDPAASKEATADASQNGGPHRPYWIKKINGKDIPQDNSAEKEAVSRVEDMRTKKNRAYPDPDGVYRR